MKRISCFLLAVVLLLGLCSCDGFEDTPETEAAFAAYEAAILQSTAHKKGEITVATVNKNTIEKTETLGVIEYSYTTDENDKVSFERNDFTDGDLVASYYGDGAAAYQMDFTTGKWVDVTKDSKLMLTHGTNYMNTLSLFRIDNQFRYSKRFYESVTMKEEKGEKIITFTLKNKAVTEMLDFSDEKGIRREMAHQYRAYYVNEAGDVYKIVIDTLQNVEFKGEKGTLSNVITIDINYK